MTKSNILTDEPTCAKCVKYNYCMAHNCIKVGDIGKCYVEAWHYDYRAEDLRGCDR